MKSIIVLLLLTACASNKDVIQGYSGPELYSVLRKLEGKSRQDALKILGTPAVAGRCKFMCGPKDIYRMIYPSKDTRRFYLDVMANTDQKIDCVVFDFYPDKKRNKFVFKRNSFKKAKDCNNKDGEIQFLRNYMMSESGKTTIQKQ